MLFSLKSDQRTRFIGSFHFFTHFFLFQIYPAFPLPPTFGGEPQNSTREPMNGRMNFESTLGEYNFTSLKASNYK
jgi:hypothetical protein